MARGLSQRTLWGRTKEWGGGGEVWRKRLIHCNLAARHIMGKHLRADASSRRGSTFFTARASPSLRMMMKEEHLQRPFRWRSVRRRSVPAAKSTKTGPVAYGGPANKRLEGATRA
ncbi:hypothetical protein KFL_000840010 [Klebsormidium nitens]|uniref:Uncharacterized protein n=1 Tax=Klebsormidium nitens TaxID=105231 RepID=A0A1Y1I0C8_KLENI|nr:hypothetical protein KFL_000840010 [Klebsormidium nitens]|eukprot:GAQ81558.1 hypothetical protein KFL_000840010 [Klebsormidium nitens]